MISVCLACYNGENFIRQQIDSILVQLAPLDELLISDDGSTDQTLKIITRYRDSRIKLLYNKKDLTILKKRSSSWRFASKNFENAIQQAHGDYIFLADQDDIWYESKISKMLHALQKYDFVMSNFSCIDEKNALIKKKMQKSTPIKKTFIGNILKPPFKGCCIAFSKTLLPYVLPFPNYCISHDLWIGLIAFEKKSFFYIEEPLIFYRVNKNSVTFSCKTYNKNPLWYKIYYRIIIMIASIKRFYFIKQKI